jgi:hypothetical protein
MKALFILRSFRLKGYKVPFKNGQKSELTLLLGPRIALGQAEDIRPDVPCQDNNVLSVKKKS